jgi:two-component system nitrate/nitrite response regulator NarL
VCQNACAVSSLGEQAALRIVIADHHPHFRAGVRLAIEKLGHYAVICEAADLSSVIDCVQRERPRLLLLAFKLSDGSGIEALRRLRDLGVRVPVILLATSIERAQVMLALQLGARGVVLKDAAPEILLKAMDAVLRGELWISRNMFADFADCVVNGGGPLLALTARERQIIDCILAGKMNREIGQQLGIAEDTVKRHVTHIYDKLGVSSRLELALYCSSGKFSV